MILALSNGVVLAWWIALAVGLVVALVVVVLLETLRRTVGEIDTGVAGVWTSGKLVAQNTWTAHLFATTKARGIDLLSEVRHHAAAAERSKP